MSVRESPILLFAVLGIAVFLLYTHLKPPDRETILVTRQTIDALVQRQERVTRKPVTSEERRALIEGYIEDEILLREAYRLGFAKNVAGARDRTLAFMRNSLSEVVSEPSPSQLRTLYEEDRERYRTSPSFTFEHVYFSFAGNHLPDDPASFLQHLEGEPELSKVGDFAPMGNRFSKASSQEIVRIFGNPFARALYETPRNKWAGPVESSRGVHYVRVTGRHDPEPPSFEAMEPYLRREFRMQRSRESLQRKIDAFRKNYEIVVE